ncbi:MAG: SPOR domain-containing protein [Gallionellaceae bacterium]|nr:SPOR domain-containing protein [Gallionellaceae bacterium]
MNGEKSKVVAGLIIGMVLGLVIAGGVAWYVVNKNPAEFAAKGKTKPAPAVTLAPASPPAVAPAAGETEPGQQFEFYKVLTDKSGSTARKPATKPQETATAKAPAPGAAASKELYFVQAGSFQNEGDAEKLKAKLAFSGFEASIQTATIPDKGIWHRVRLGPYEGAEAGKTIMALRQNGIIATQVRVQ